MGVNVAVGDGVAVFEGTVAVAAGVSAGEGVGLGVTVWQANKSNVNVTNRAIFFILASMDDYISELNAEYR